MADRDMSGSNFTFEGDFYRKPEQRLGGASKNESKDMVITRAQAERRKRENERKYAKSVLIVQACVRSFLARCRFKDKLRANFDSISDNPSNKGFDQAFAQLVFFYTHGHEHDAARLFHFSSCVARPGLKLFLISQAESDPVWQFRLSKILRICLSMINVPKSNPKNYLRFIEALTDYPADSEDGLIVMSRLWLHMTTDLNFFGEMRKFMEKYVPEPIELTNKPRQHATQLSLSLLERPIVILNKLRLMPVFTCKPVEDLKIESGSQAARVIVKYFTNAFSGEIIPLEHGDKHKSYSNLVAYLILPYMTPLIPMDYMLSSLERRCCFTHNQARSFLYYGLALINQNHEWKVGDENLFSAISKVLHSFLRSIQTRVEPSYNTVTPGEIPYEDEEDEDMEVPAATIIRLKETKITFELLKKVINQLPSTWWAENFFKKGEMESFLDFTLGLIKLDPKFAHVHFKFLSTISFDKTFVRKFYDKSFGRRAPFDRDDKRLMFFSWTFNHFMSTLHDAEFFQAIPLTNEELSTFISIMTHMYDDAVISDRDDTVDEDALDLTKILAFTLNSIYERNTRMTVYSEELFVSKEFSRYFPFSSHTFTFKELQQNLPRLPVIESKMMRVLRECPFLIKFHDRVKVWNRLLEHEKINNYRPRREQIQIRRDFIYEDSFEKLSYENVHDIKDHIQISLVNVVGADEPGVDGGGLLREFLGEVTKAGVQPNLGLFRYDSQNRLYPNPIAKKIVPNFQNHFFLMGRLVGKALYEQILLDLPFSAIFIHKIISGNVGSAVDYLAILEPEMHKNLLALKHFVGDWNSLGLDFTLTVEELGETRSIELKPNGGSIPVDKTNIIEYIHLVGDYKVNREIEEECRSFRMGLNEVVSINKLFSWTEMQIMISGSEKSIEVEDWMENTNYIGVYNPEHPTIKLFWKVVKTLTEEELRKLLKFVTSCTRPPLLGFRDLVPKFGIQSGGTEMDRLPTSATCMNLLKLPEYGSEEVLKERIHYAINSGAGFELS